MGFFRHLMEVLEELGCLGWILGFGLILMVLGDIQFWACVFLVILLIDYFVL